MGQRLSGSRRGSRFRIPLSCLVPVALLACLPQLPTYPEASDPSDPRVRLSEPVVWVSDPQNNGVMSLEELFSAKGAPVEFEGTFKPGQELHLLAAREQTPNLGFYIIRLPITDTVSPGPAFIQSSPAILFNTHRIRLKLSLRDPDGSVVSIDSVNVNLR